MRRTPRLRRRASGLRFRRYARIRIAIVATNHASYQIAARGYARPTSATGPRAPSATPPTIQSVPTTRVATTAETPYVTGGSHGRDRNGWPVAKFRAKWRNVPEVRAIPTHWTRIHGRRAAGDASGAKRTTASPRSHIANATVRSANGRRVGVCGTRATMYAARAVVAIRLAADAIPQRVIGPPGYSVTISNRPFWTRRG
jgi:hypothetical protein